MNLECDNSDHKGEVENPKEVTMKQEFEGGTVVWCEKCRERDREMIAVIPKAREVVEKLREQVNNGESKPLEGIAKHRLIDKLKEIVEIKEERTAMLEAEIEYDKERLIEIGERQQELIAELKSHGMPHHPVMGSKSDYEQAQTV